jgi:aminoglycoside phosphotransferase (APT) family kinase protein
MLLDKFAGLVAAMEPQGKLLQAQALTGGISAQTSLLSVQDGKDQIIQLVVRCPGLRDLELHPHMVSHEFRLLSYLYEAGLPVPRPYFIDADGTYLSRPCLVYSYIPGHTLSNPKDLSPYLGQMADTLALIHRFSTTELTFLPMRKEEIASWLTQPGLEDEARALLQAAWPWGQKNRSVLLHGDYWPGNILWRGERLVGVIDWEDAALGDPLADLASTRLEVLWSFGKEAMDHFTVFYCQANPVDTTNLAYYDLLTAAQVAPKIENWGLDAATHKAMGEKLQFFAAEARKIIVE